MPRAAAWPARAHPLATDFRDHFSGHAQAYAAFRPAYPEPLFAWLATVAPSRRFAWDVATGNGQAAVALARHFERVLATDGSAAQLAHAVAHPRVEYRVAVSGSLSEPPHDVDLITVAQALHWLDRPRFFPEIRRALAPRGVFAVWSYALCRVSPDVDAATDYLYRVVLHGWWTPERLMVEQGYRGMDLPFEEFDPPTFEMVARWDLAQFRGYLGTWSGLRRYRRETGKDPLELIARRLDDAWGPADRLQDVVWPLTVRACRKPDRTGSPGANAGERA